ncbi:hypothetical protein [Oceaniradius stylonematis]|uniref:hypothetical protein n=1 Tax=Oceaniradius stylonematis TaxID=2184161 RepID=UPI0026A08C1E|nr:hypothetical protein [Oceaniradius stylonematis]
MSNRVNAGWLVDIKWPRTAKYLGSDCYHVEATVTLEKGHAMNHERVVFSMLVALVFPFFTAKSHAQQYGTEFCNDSDSKLYVAIASQVGMDFLAGRWSMTGRYIMVPGECIRRSSINSAAGWAYLAAWTEGRLWGYREVELSQGNVRGRNVRIANANHELCVRFDAKFDARAATLSGLKNCSFPNGKLIRFGVSLDLRDNYTFRTVSIR